MNDQNTQPTVGQGTAVQPTNTQPVANAQQTPAAQPTAPAEKEPNFFQKGVRNVKGFFSKF
jgi:hypothetical protein